MKTLTAFKFLYGKGLVAWIVVIQLGDAILDLLK